MAEERQKRKKRSKEEVAAARQYYLEEKEKRRREREEKRKAYEEAKAARQKAREERAKLREMRASRKSPKNRVKSLEETLVEVFHSIPPYKGKLEVGDRVVFQFAGGYHIGEIKEITMDKVFGEGQYKDLKVFKVVEYGTKYPCSKERILAKIDKEKFK